MVTFCIQLYHFVLNLQKYHNKAEKENFALFYFHFHDKTLINRKGVLKI